MLSTQNSLRSYRSWLFFTGQRFFSQVYTIHSTELACLVINLTASTSFNYGIGHDILNLHLSEEESAQTVKCLV